MQEFFFGVISASVFWVMYIYLNKKLSDIKILKEEQKLKDLLRDANEKPIDDVLGDLNDFLESIS